MKPAVTRATSRISTHIHLASAANAFNAPRDDAALEGPLRGVV
jgi:hypothetical protein